MYYNNLTLRHFEGRAAGILPGAGVRRGSAGDAQQGTWVQFHVRLGVRESLDVIDEVRFLAFGCPHVIAVADWLAETTVGQAAVAQLPESVHALRQRFDMPVEKLGRVLVVEDAWIAALSSPCRG